MTQTHVAVAGTRQVIMPFAQPQEPTLASIPRIPSEPYLRQITGARKEYSPNIKNACHGLEMLRSMKFIYPHMNTAESVFLSMVMYQEMRKPNFAKFVKGHSVEEVVDALFTQKGYENDLDLLSGKLSRNMQIEDKQLNPYSRSQKNSTLKRFKTIPRELKELFTDDLLQEWKRFVTIGMYNPEAPAMDAIEVPMHYQPVSLDRRNGHVFNRNFAKRMINIIDGYYPK